MSQDIKMEQTRKDAELSLESYDFERAIRLQTLSIYLKMISGINVTEGLIEIFEPEIEYLGRLLNNYKNESEDPELERRFKERVIPTLEGLATAYPNSSVIQEIHKNYQDFVGDKIKCHKI